MSEFVSFELTCVSKALSPLTHNKSAKGNETIVSQESVAASHGICVVPVLSGNAIRHRMVREPGARFLVERWGLAGNLELRILQFLFHGGALTEGSPSESAKRIRQWWKLFPLMRVIGGCLPNQIIGGALHCWHGVLACRENEERIKQSVPSGWMPEGHLLPARRFLSSYQYVRRDASQTVPDLEREQIAALPKKSGMMIYVGQQVSSGAVFVHGFLLREAKRVDIGCLLHSLNLWQSRNGTIGGMAAKGHGRLQMSMAVRPEFDEAGAIAEYVSHVDSVKDEAISWMRSELG